MPNHFFTGSPETVPNLWTKVMNFTLDETLEQLNVPKLPETTEFPEKYRMRVFEALLLIRRYSFQQSPHDISRASLILLQFVSLNDAVSCCFLFFVLACRSLDIFERTTEIGHLDRAVALLEDIWENKTLIVNFRFAVGLTLCRACMLHYLVSDEPRARESAVNIFGEIRRSLPSWVPPSNAKTLMILGDIMQRLYISEQNIDEVFLSTITSIVGSIDLTPGEFTAFQALVISLIFTILRTEHGTWQQKINTLYVAVSSPESTIKNTAQLNRILDSMEEFPMSSAKPLCLFYIADVLDTEGFTPPNDSEICDSDESWTNECKKAMGHLRKISVSEACSFTFIPFTLKGYAEHRPNSGMERYIQAANSTPFHVCVFKISILTAGQSGPLAEISHEHFCRHLQKLCDTAPSSQLEAAVEQAENLDRFLDMSPYLRHTEERIIQWRQSATTKAYIMFRLNMKDSKVSKKIATDFILALEQEPGHAKCAYQLASNLCNLENDNQSLNIASRLFSEFLRIQQRGSIKWLIAMLALAEIHMLIFLQERRKKRIPSLVFALELFREAIESSNMITSSHDSWSVEARKVIVIGRILHYRFSRFSDSDASLEVTFTDCKNLLDHLPIGLPFCASTLEVLVITTLLYLSRHTKTAQEWNNSVKYFSRVVDKLANGTDVDGVVAEGDGYAHTIVNEVIAGGLDPAHSIEFASEAMCVLHMSDMFRAIGQDCCENPGFLRVSVDSYHRNLDLGSKDDSARYQENEHILQSHNRYEKEALRNGMLALVIKPAISMSDANPQVSSLAPGSFLIFKYRAGYLTPDNMSSTAAYTHDCVLRFIPVQVSQFTIDIESGLQDDEETESTPSSWPEDLMMLPHSMTYPSPGYGMPSTLIPGFDKISINERHELFKMPLEARTIRALMRSVDSEVRDMEKSSSYVVENFIRELRQPPTWNRANVGLQARIDQIRNLGQDITQYGPLQALLTRGPERCLELIESTRSIFWTRLLRLKTSFAGLPDDLARAFKEVAEEIEDLQSNTALTGTASEEERQRQFELEVIFDSMIKKARLLPGFDNFLRPKTHDILMNASSGGPIAVLLGTKSIYVALIVRPTGIDPVFLPDLTDELLDKLAINFNNAYQNARSMSYEEVHSPDRFGRPKRKTLQDYNVLLEKLWKMIVRPIFNFLGLLSCRESLSERPRFWWCPTGKFSLLPIHAAATDFGASDFDCAWNYVVSSYTPTLHSLISARSSWEELQKKSISELEVLAIAQSKTSGLSDLPKTLEELKIVENVVPSHQLIYIKNSTLPHQRLSQTNSNRTVAEVTNSLTRASILHLACHGRQNRKDPLNSGFALEDGRLSLAKLISSHTPNAFFAFLSSCESAAVDIEILDESLSLSAAMLYTGFRSVIGTMWTMDDNDGPEIARTIYQELFKDKKDALEPNVIPFALDAAVRKLYHDGVHPTRWATYVHVGM